MSMKEIDCRVFEDQLELLVGGRLPEEGMRQLRLHAESCPACAMLLRVQDHLAYPPLEALEEAVPAAWLDTVWSGVEARLPSRAHPARRSAWIVPTLAAAAVALLFSSGFFFLELRRTETQGVRLAEQVTALQREMAELDARTEWVERTAQLAGRGRSTARALDFLLAGQESVTVEALARLLDELPADLVLFEASRLEALLGPSLPPPPELRDLLILLADGLRSVHEGGEVFAGDLASWLSDSGLSPNLEIPKAPLMDLLS